MIATNLLRSLPPIPQFCPWKEGTPMSGKKASRSLFSDSVTEEISPDFPQKTCGTVAVNTVSPSPSGPESFLPLDWVLNSDKGTGPSERVMARLLLAEAKSGDHEHKLAYRLAWHIVLHCMKGDAVECSPVTLAYYSVVGCHEEQYYDRVMIRRAAMFGTANVIKFPSPKLSPKSSPKKSDEEKTA